MMTEIYLIRHADPLKKDKFNIISKKESFDLSNEKAILSITGESKAEKVSKLDFLHGIDAVYSSNYSRAFGTAKYFARENNTVINIDDRFNERKVGEINPDEWHTFEEKQQSNFDYKLLNGESINDTKKRMIEALKNVLMFETGNRVIIVSHSTAITALLTTWCDRGYNYDDHLILSYNDQTIIDGTWTAPMIFKLVFDGMDIQSIEKINYDI